MSNDADNATSALADSTAALEQRVAAIEQAWRARVVRAELKAEAMRAGMIDLDGLRLIDMDTVRVNDDGAVEGGAALMQALRRQKPWLFTAPSSSSLSVPPAAASLDGRPAMHMTHTEWQAARAELLRRR